VELATFGEGDFFGDQVLLDESARTASAIARAQTRAVGFFRPDLLELIERNPHLGLKIVMRLSHMISVRLRHNNRLLKETRDQVRRAEAQRQAESQVADTEAEAAP
jgi:CRP/FNR family cyclic AMP-dependent transcriptional regulator